MTSHAEHDEQIAVVAYLTLRGVLFWATPNGAYLAGDARHRAMQMQRLQREGVRPGVSDLIIFEPRGGYSALFLEMKAQGGRVAESQKQFLAEVEARGGYGAVAYGADEAIEIVEAYLRGEISMGAKLEVIKDDNLSQSNRTMYKKRTLSDMDMSGKADFPDT